MNSKRELDFGIVNPALALGIVILLAPIATAQRDRQPQRALSRIENTRQDWTIRYEMRYGGVHDERGNFGRIIDQGVAWAPIMPNTAISDAHAASVTGTLDFRPAQTITEYEVLDGYQSGASYASWIMQPCKIDEVSFRVEFPVSSFETRIDEGIAQSRVWPSEAWSSMLANCLEPQRYVESDDPIVGRLVEKWTNGKPKKAKPYMLAKYLASKVIEHVQVNDTRYVRESGSLVTGRRSVNYIRGFDVNGASAIARSGKGTRYDVACLLCAAYRAAGLPARLVIGIDELEQREETLPAVNAWVEFFLPFTTAADDSVGAQFVTEDDGEWIPVDIFRQLRFSSRPPALDRPWKFVGNHEHGERLAPFSFHWVSPDVSHAFPDATISPIGLGTNPPLLVGTGGITTTIMGTAKRGGR